MKVQLLLFLVIEIFISAYAWDNEEMEIFDLVEDINKKFL